MVCGPNNKEGLNSHRASANQNKNMTTNTLTAPVGKKIKAEEALTLIQQLQARVAELEAEKIKGRGGMRINRVRPSFDFPAAIALISLATLDNGKELNLKAEKDAEQLSTVRVIYNEKDNSILNILMGDRFSFIKNTDLISSFESHLEKQGYSITDPTHIASFDGLSYSGRYNQKQPSVKIAGEKFTLQFVVNNGYDGKTKPTISTRATRAADGISFNIPSKDYPIVKDNKLDDATLEASIKTATKDFDSIMEIFEQMSKIELTHTEGANILARLCEKDLLKVPVFGKRSGKGIKDIWLAQKDNLTLFGLYLCAATYYSTKVEGPVESGSLNQYERSISSQNYLLGHFVNATNDKNVRKSITDTKAKIDLDKARETTETETQEAETEEK